MLQYASRCQSLHIGINNYGDSKSSYFKSVKKSQYEATLYWKFFKDYLKYHDVSEIIDNEAGPMGIR